MKFEKYITPRLIVYALIIFLLLIFWSGITILVRIIAIGYLIYTIFCLFSDGLAHPRCWFRFIIAIIISIIAFILTTKFFLALLILLMLIDLIYDYWKPTKK
jgi:hypothetical protein|tara:strand:+ start:893 stop:1198 length:306 start_codon:yes stop_codon:yes gene_type:complete